VASEVKHRLNKSDSLPFLPAGPPRVTMTVAPPRRKRLALPWPTLRAAFTKTRLPVNSFARDCFDAVINGDSLRYCLIRFSLRQLSAVPGDGMEPPVLVCEPILPPAIVSRHFHLLLLFSFRFMEPDWPDHTDAS